MATEPLETRIDRAIAASGVPWAGPGAACVDPETGVRYRRLPNAWVSEADHGTVAPTGAGGSAQFKRALANGPKLDDAATLGCLLGQMPEAELCQVRQSFNGNVADVVLGWWCGPRYHPTMEVPTRAEAIARAWLAAHGVAVPPAEPAEVGGEGGSDGE